MKSFLLFFLFFSIFFSDAGPSLPAPEIEVKFIKEAQDYVGDIELAYHCTAELGQDRNRISVQRDVNMSCSAGICKNDNWFYKFNPCYSKESGNFLYKVGNSNFKMANGDFVFEEGRIYKISIDIDRNKAELISSSYCCFPLFLFLFISILTFKAGKQKCN
ncbi:hypothetical protein J4450_01695 [Candidatus Micrarchaeota archaeon]|nr:hypothetical protein [Candidatus Micrarchaeota archaeon]